MMFPGSRSCIKIVSRVVWLLTHIDDARAYIVPYLHHRFISRHLTPTVGLNARGFTIRWVQSSSMTTVSLSPHRSSNSDASRSSSTQRPRGLDINIALVCSRSDPPDQETTSRSTPTSAPTSSVLADFRVRASFPCPCCDRSQKKR